MHIHLQLPDKITTLPFVLFIILKCNVSDQDSDLPHLPVHCVEISTNWEKIYSDQWPLRCSNNIACNCKRSWVGWQEVNQIEQNALLTSQRHPVTFDFHDKKWLHVNINAQVSDMSEALTLWFALIYKPDECLHDGTAHSYHLFIPLSVTLAIFQGNSSVEPFYRFFLLIFFPYAYPV